MTTILAPDAQFTPLTPRRPTAMPGVGTFDATNNLIGAQVNPTDSRTTRQAQDWTTQSGAAYNGFNLTPFQGVQPLDLSGSRGMVNGANSAMQGLSYDFGGANGQYGAAQGQQAAAQQAGMGYLGQAGAMAGAGAAGGSTNGGNGYTQAGDVGGARALAMQGLQGLQGPDRAKLAAEALQLLEERSNPGYEQSLRAVGQRAAAMGRRGSGITTNELGDVTLGRERELALARRDAATQAAGQTLADRLAVNQQTAGVAQGFGSLDQQGASINDAAARASSGFSQQNASRSLDAANVMRGIGGDVYGMGRDASNLSMSVGDRYGDQARDRTGLGERQAGFQRTSANDLAGYGRDEYSARVNERDAARSDEYGQGNFLRSRFGDNAGYLNQTQGQDRANRNEIRGERGYQYGLSQDAIDNDFRTQAWEEQLRNGRYNRALGTTNVGYGAPSPVGAYGNAAGQYGAEAQDLYGAIGEFAGAYGNRRKGAGGYPLPAADGGATDGGSYALPNQIGSPSRRTGLGVAY